VTDRPSHVWVDGRLLPADGAHLSVFDRGFQLGDGVFETLRVRGGRATELAEHLARLRRSADGLGFELPDAIDRWLPAGIAELLAAEGLGGPDGDASVRITASRGVFFGRGLLAARRAPHPTIAIQAWPVPPTPAAHLEQGLSLVASRVRRDPGEPAVGAEDDLARRLRLCPRGGPVGRRGRRAVPHDRRVPVRGDVGERVLVRGSELATPALGCAILPGTTRDWILRWAAGVGLAPHEAWLTTRDLADADEAFISSSVAGILPVTAVRGRPDRPRPAGRLDDARPRRPRGVHPRRGRRWVDSTACVATSSSPGPAS
jgi:branched-chain amino acid aminotransferase